VGAAFRWLSHAPLSRRHKLEETATDDGIGVLLFRAPMLPLDPLQRSETLHSPRRHIIKD
jgi:hypothetical protein